MAPVAGMADQDLEPSTAGLSLHDTISPRYPDRPIRPLPKRKLRARLSDEQAGSIDWPLVVPSSSSSFGSPQSQSGIINYPSFAHTEPLHNDVHNAHSEHFCDCGGEHYRSEFESEEEEIRPSNPTSMLNGAGRSSHDPRPPHHSPASSADGYESFENTNNKKKRKIPVAGMGQGGSIVDVTREDGSGQPSQVYQPYDGEDASQRSHDFTSPGSSSGVGISGAGRGRQTKSSFRSGDTRRPLAASSNAANAGIGDASGGQSQGIIGSALSKAAGKGPMTSAAKGQENLSLLQRGQQGPSSPEGFTFQCPSDSSGKMNLPHRPNPGNLPPPPQGPPPLSVNSRTSATHGTQMNQGAMNPPATTNGMAASSSSHTGPLPQDTPQGADQRRPRRPAREYAIQARQRRMEQDYKNYHNPPKREDVWVCEFCEYEAIFGVPPTALIRQYEVKDYKERKIAEERRRLLEKAKAKSRKNKKNSKGGNKNAANASAHGSAGNHRYDGSYDNPSPQNPDDLEEYIEDDDLDRADLHSPPLPHDSQLMPPPPPANHVALADGGTHR